jgi:signal transduction histidine kinase
MLNVVDTMRKHGDDQAIRQRSLDLLERGLAGIGNVVRATLATYKGSAVPNRLRGRDLDDLQFLLQHELRRRHLHLVWRNLVPESVAVDGAAVRQIALNLLLNACAASPDGGVIEFDARFDGQRVAIVVGDHGPGLPESVAALLREPARAPRVPDNDIGLGVWTVCQLVSQHGGAIEVGTTGGTKLVVTLPARLEARLDAVA